MSREYGSRGAYRALAAIFRFIHYGSTWQRPEQHWNWEASLRGTHSGRECAASLAIKKCRLLAEFSENSIFLYGGAKFSENEYVSQNFKEILETC